MLLVSPTWELEVSLYYMDIRVYFSQFLPRKCTEIQTPVIYLRVRGAKYELSLKDPAATTSIYWAQQITARTPFVLSLGSGIKNS